MALSALRVREFLVALCCSRFLEIRSSFVVAMLHHVSVFSGANYANGKRLHSVTPVSAITAGGP